MPAPHPAMKTLVAFLSAAMLGASAAAADLDLKRVTPVAPEQPIPIQDFFRPRLIGDVQLNPAGTHVAALMAVVGQDKIALSTIDLASNKTETVGGVRQQDIYDVQWIDDRRVAFRLADRKLYSVALMAADVGQLHKSYPLQAYNGARIIGIPPGDRRRPLVQVNANAFVSEGARNRDFAAVTVNTDNKNLVIPDLTREIALTGEAWFKAKENNEKNIVRIQRGPAVTLPMGLMADRNGALEFAFAAEGGRRVLYRLAGSDWQQSPLDVDRNAVIGPGRHPGELVLAAVSRTASEPAALRYANAFTGELDEVLVQDKEYDFDGSIYRDPKSREVVGAYYERAGPQSVWFRDDYQAAQKLFSVQFPGQAVRIIDNSEDGRIFLLQTYSDRHPSTYHWVNLAEKKAGLIKNSAPWIDPQRMRPMTIIKYKTRDGRALDAYLTLPEGASKENRPPLVVLCHGGPWARDTWGFNGEAQFLASRGYAVLQPNYRGSTSYEWLFPYEDRFAFRKMHDDVTDAVNTVLRGGLADRRRVAIMGASFGAYLALSGVAHEPTLYRCAVTNAGVFDWEEVIREHKFDQYDDTNFSALVLHLGDPAKEPEKFVAISPLRHVAKVRVPVFVAHGRYDPVASVLESRRLVAALEKHKVTHEALFVAEEGHGMGNLKNQVDLYGRIETFLARHLMPLPANAATATPVP